MAGSFFRRHPLATTLAIAAGTALGAILIGGKRYAAPAYQGPVSDHFDGTRFHNRERSEHGFAAVLKWVANRQKGFWPDWIESSPGAPPPRRVEGARVTFINHSTVLLQVAGANILTDPIWSERTSPVDFAGPKRHRAPGIRLEDLPKIDAILISHNHYDHLDLPTLETLVRRDAPLILTPLGNRAFLQREGIAGSVDLDWWQSHRLTDGVTITMVPARHFSGRGLGDRDRTLWCGFVVVARGASYYFAGDTGYGDHFAEIGRRFAPIELSMLPIGAFLPRWFMAPVHTDPQQVVRAHRDLGARRSMAIHFGTFGLGDDGLEDPTRELAEAKKKAGLGDEEFWVLREGEARDIGN
jgi:L-ascorbate metabolism protein UlaG (beta-lactamase superfamily)